MTQPISSSYAIIPCYVMEDENLEDGAKLLYARLVMYSQEGRAWPSNKHLADKHKVTERCIQKWLRQLSQEGYIKIDVIKNGFQTHRDIWISGEFKKQITKRTTVHPDTNHSSPRHEPQFAQININKINIKKQEGESACAPAPELFICDQVKMQKSRHEKLCEKYTLQKIDEYIQRLNEYAKMKPKKFKEYGCHATVIENWIRKDEKEKPKTSGKSLDQLNENAKLAKAIEIKFPDHVETTRDHIEFKTGPIQREFLKYNENGFRDQCFNILRKMNITLSGI